MKAKETVVDIDIATCSNIQESRQRNPTQQIFSQIFRNLEPFFRQKFEKKNRIYLSVFLSIHLSIYLPIYLSTGWSKKRTRFCFSSESCFTIFCHIFQVVQTAALGDSFDTYMDPTGQFTMQQWIKIIEAYFATKSVPLTQQKCRRDFCRNNVPDRKTI